MQPFIFPTSPFLWCIRPLCSWSHIDGSLSSIRRAAWMDGDWTLNVYSKSDSFVALDHSNQDLFPAAIHLHPSLSHFLKHSEVQCRPAFLLLAQTWIATLSLILIFIFYIFFLVHSEHLDTPVTFGCCFHPYSLPSIKLLTQNICCSDSNKKKEKEFNVQKKTRHVSILVIFLSHIWLYYVSYIW